MEITESTLMLDPEQVMKTIHQLRGSGFAFALDDFGTEYSSLAYLKNLSVTVLISTFVAQGVERATC